MAATQKFFEQPILNSLGGRPGDGRDTPLTLILEVKGFRGHDVPLKSAAVRDRWIPAVERLGRFGRWDFGELRDPCRMQEDLDELVMQHGTKAVA